MVIFLLSGKNNNEKKKSNISFSLLSLSLFLFLTFTFSSHVFCLPDANAYSLENNSISKHTKVSFQKNDINDASFISEAEEVECIRYYNYIKLSL